MKKNQTILNFSLTSVVLLFCFSALGAEEPLKTKTDTNREVALTYAQIYLEQKLYDEAETTLQLSVKNDGEDGAILNFLGLIQLRQKNYSQACYSFQRSAVVFQDVQGKIYANYNLADCLYQGGRKQEAIRVLKDLMPKEEGISDSAEKTLELIDSGIISLDSPLPPYQKHSRGRYRLTTAISGGFDTNVLLVEEAVAAGTAVKDRGSFYYSPTLQLGYLGRVFGQNLDARLITAYTNYTASNASSFNNLYNRLDLFFGSNTIKWDVFSDLIFLNSGSFAVYNYDAGLMWQRVKKVGSNDTWIFELPLKYQKYILTDGVSADNDRAGADLQAKVTYRSQWSELESYSIGGVFDQQYTKGKNYRLSGFTIPISAGIELPGFSSIGLLNTFTAEFSTQLYWQSDVNRRDYSYKFSTGIAAPLFESWNLSLDYYYMKNNSNVDAATYTKGVASFLLSHNFL